jgi:hypothetical protein
LLGYFHNIRSVGIAFRGTRQGKIGSFVDLTIFSNISIPSFLLYRSLFNFSNHIIEGSHVLINPSPSWSSCSADQTGHDCLRISNSNCGWCSLLEECMESKVLRVNILNPAHSQKASIRKISQVFTGSHQSIYCPMHYWVIRGTSRSNSLDDHQNSTSSHQVPYYIPIIMVPIIACFVICHSSKQRSFLRASSGKALNQIDNESNTKHPRWVPRKSSLFGVVPMMQSWTLVDDNRLVADQDNEELGNVVVK